MKNFKFFALALFGICLGFSAYAEDALSVAERTDCENVQSRISALEEVEALSDVQKNELEQLKTLYRRDCSKSAGERSSTTTSVAKVAVAKATAVLPKSTQPVVVQTAKTADEVLKTFLDGKQTICDSFKKSIDSAKDWSDEDKQKLQSQYDVDCLGEEELTDEEVRQNRMKGICPEGKKVNKFGCCEGETFKDMGSLTFKCCPENGGECYPTVYSGTAL